MAKKKADTATIDFERIGAEIDVIMTEIYGHYVAQGSPTKLGGLRFLDVPSAKTFAFESARPHEAGNLLVVSAPFRGNQQVIEQKLRDGPYADEIHEVIVRTSADAGKKGKYFVEAGYLLPTATWLSDDAVRAVAEEHHCNGTEAVRLLLKQHVLPRAGEIMKYFITAIREISD